MSKENKEQLIKRVKSFAWRLGAVVLAGGVAFLAENLELFELSPQVTIVVGLVLGEVTKYLNQK